MPDPDTDRIIILAQSGVTIRQAEAAIGRRMTESERQAWDKAQVRRKLERAGRNRREILRLKRRAGKSAGG